MKLGFAVNAYLIACYYRLFKCKRLLIRTDDIPVQRRVFLRRRVPGKVLLHRVSYDPAPPFGLIFRREGAIQRLLELRDAVVGKEEAGAVRRTVRVDDGVCEAAGGARDRDGAVGEGDELRKAAGLE